MFGTFRDKLKETGTSYKGGSEENVDAKSAAIHDSKASLRGLPDAGFAIYIMINCVIWAMVWLAIQKQYGLHEWHLCNIIEKSAIFFSTKNNCLS